MLLPDIVNSPEHGEVVRNFMKNARNDGNRAQIRKKLHKILKVNYEP